MNIKSIILNELKKQCPGNRIVLPRDIDLEFDQNTLIMYLKKTAIKSNMQDDATAFEGWAVVIKSFWKSDCDYNIKIDISDNEMVELPNPREVFVEKKYLEKKESGHYGRFLYRANKFSEEFEWVCLSEKIQKCVDIYEKLLEENKCTNHLPDKDAGENPRPEIQAEASFHENPAEIEKLTKNQVMGNVYRQLGTWLESEDGNIQFLTAGRSAIDLWNITNDTLNIFELKAVTGSNHNYKVGIITELFMYMEYCRDMFLKDSRFTPRYMDAESTVGRGYGKLVNQDIESIRGYFLSNKYHPLLSKKVVDLLNTNKSGMEYNKLDEYNWEYMIRMRKPNSAPLRS